MTNILLVLLFAVPFSIITLLAAMLINETGEEHDVAGACIVSYLITVVLIVGHFAVLDGYEKDREDLCRIRAQASSAGILREIEVPVGSRKSFELILPAEKSEGGTDVPSTDVPSTGKQHTNN